MMALTFLLPSMAYCDLLCRTYYRFGFDKKILEAAYEYTWACGRKAKN